MVPREAFFTRGVGRHKERLQSFEWALRQAGIAQYNLVRVSSIYPPGCRIISRNKGVAKLKPGEVVYADISEHHCNGMAAKKGADYVEDMAASMLASTLGIRFDPETGYDERKEIYRMSGKIVRTRATVQTATGGDRGLWTTVVSAVVFVP